MVLKIELFLILYFNNAICTHYTTGVWTSFARIFSLFATHLVIQASSSYKDLGVIMSRDLSWSNHVDTLVNKANKVLGLLKRTIGSKNREIFSVLYRSLVRPLLEYASPVWSPYLVKDKLAIESIQSRASRIVLGQKRHKISYEDRCELLGWSTLERQREYFSLVVL